MILDHFGYIKTEPLSGDIRTDIKNLLFINGKCNTFIHASNVAERNALIAKAYNLDHDKCVIAGLLHDISAIIKPEDMLKYACENHLDICEAERKYPSKCEMALFIADKLAWDKSGIPPFYEEVNAALYISLEAACYKYMKYMVDNDMILCPHDNWIEAYEQLKMGEADFSQPQSGGYL